MNNASLRSPPDFVPIASPRESSEEIVSLEPVVVSSFGQDGDPTEVRVTPGERRGSEIASGTLAGRYVLERLLGRGGMGEVYLAHDPELGRRVAIKVMPRIIDGCSSWQRARLEAWTVAALRHPNIVQLFDLGMFSTHGAQRPYLVFEYIEGGTLQQTLKGAPLDCGVVVRIVLQAAEALAAAHSAGIVHRDLKPSNLLLSPTYSVKVADFGLARRMATLEQIPEGPIVGTPVYMAPELADGHAFSPASDVYSLGVVLYECLTGRPPFRGACSVETLVLARSTEVISPRVLNAAVGPELAKICMQCLAKTPEGRLSDASQLAAQLRRWLAEFARTESNHQPHELRPRGGITRPRLWIGTAVISLLIAGFLGAWLSELRNSLLEPKEGMFSSADDRERLETLRLVEQLRERLSHERFGHQPVARP